MRRAGILAAVLIAGFVGGCLDDQKVQMAKCRLEAQKVYPDWGRAPYGQPGGMIALCMQAAGYEYDVRSKKCKASMWMAEDVWCYVPSGRVARLIYEIEMAMER